MTRVDKPWGYELIFAHTDRYAGKVLFIKKGARLSYQYHEKKDEAFFIDEGKVEILLDGGAGEHTVVLGRGESLHLPPGTKHRTMALEDTLIFEVSTPELDDVVRLSDDYGRVKS